MWYLFNKQGLCVGSYSYPVYLDGYVAVESNLRLDINNIVLSNGEISKVIPPPPEDIKVYEEKVDPARTEILMAIAGLYEMVAETQEKQLESEV